MYKTEYTVNDSDLFPLLDEQSNQFIPVNYGTQLLGLFDSDLHIPVEIQEDAQKEVSILECQTDYKQLMSPRGPPLRSDFVGPLNFSIEIDSRHTKKKKYLYSHILNRIYVDMNENFSVGFRWETNKFIEDAYIRATTVFADDAQAEKRVERCFQHRYKSPKPTGELDDEPQVKTMNILHSAREYSSPDVQYYGVPENSDYWFSVVVRTPQPTELAFLFVCKSTCSSGINRRPIKIIFTLEDITGKVYGRQSVGARVCSCPRRDMGRDEENGEIPKNKRPIKHPVPTQEVLNQEPKFKKVKVEGVEKNNATITLPSFEVVGLRTAIIGMEVMLNMMEQSRDGLVANRHTTDAIDTCITNLKGHINNLKGYGQE